MSRRPRGGRPRKGERDLLVTRPARAGGNVARARADEQGLTIGDYIAASAGERTAHGSLAGPPGLHATFGATALWVPNVTGNHRH